jgi:subtilisin family serine protease
MNRWKSAIFVTTLVVATGGQSAVALAAVDSGDLVPICETLYSGVFGVPNGEPLGVCQWDMALINASDEGSYAKATGKGVTVGMIDSGVDLTHPDIEPNLDVNRSCSFIYDDTPTADPQEIANGDCSNKTAVQDLVGHGTHTASTVVAPINGIGIAGVAPEATIVALKACTTEGFCFADSVAAALRWRCRRFGGLSTRDDFELGCGHKHTLCDQPFKARFFHKNFTRLHTTVGPTRS